MRPTKDEVFLSMAVNLGRLSTCARRQVGCLLVDVYGRPLSMGFNGVPREFVHCIEIPCPGAVAKSGEKLELCKAVHAEQNALQFCPDVMRIHTCYVTCSPCVHCVKMLLNTSVRRIVFQEEYSHPEAKDLWFTSFEESRNWESWQALPLRVPSVDSDDIPF